jgi:hypothetical protein
MEAENIPELVEGVKTPFLCWKGLRFIYTLGAKGGGKF